MTRPTSPTPSISESPRPDASAVPIEPAAHSLLLRHLPASLWTTDRSLRVTALEGGVNDARPGRERWIGRPLVDALAAGTDVTALVAAHERALAGEPANYRITSRGVTYEAHVEPLRDDAGAIVGVVGVGIDVTSRDRAEARATESESRLQEIAAHTREMFWTTDFAPHPHVTYVSQAYESHFELPIERAFADPLAFIERVHPDDRAHVAAAARELRNGGPLVTEYRVVRSDGSVRWLCDRAYTVRDAGGQVIRALGITEDITARRVAEEALEASRRDLLALTDNSPDVFTRYDRDYRIRFMSRAVERATGVPAEWYVGRTIHEMGMPESLTARWLAVTARVFESGEPADVEFESPAPDGTVHVYQTYVVPERDASGAVVSVLTTTRDTTERRRAEAAARAADATLRSLVEQSLTGVYVIQDGRFRWVNQRFAEIFGYDTPAEVLALEVAALVHEDDRPVVIENVRRRLAGELRTLHYAFRGRRRDGGIVHVEVYGSAAEHDARPAVVGTLLDVSEKLVLEERLRQAQKLEAIGQLAGGVAHDFNNILAAIAGYAQILRDALPPGDPHRPDIEEIIASAARGAGVTRQLLAFSRRQAIETEVLDLAAIVRDTGRMLRSLIPASIEIELPAEGTRVPVRAARAQLEQIVLNLALNARDAMPRGGRLAFAVARRDTSAREQEAVLSVSDSGTGIPVAIRERVFDPFFTTKPLGQGTGLGLATVYGLVRQFGGSVALESEEGRGTTFVVTLPLASGAPGTTPAAGVAATGAPHHVLLVEDEPAVRASTSRLLETVGYRVTTCVDGHEALARLEQGLAVDVVLTDAAMPQLDGHALAARIAARWAGLPVVLMSGYAELSERDMPAATGIVGFVQKPFSLRQLVDVLRTVVPTRAPGEPGEIGPTGRGRTD